MAAIPEFSWVRTDVLRWVKACGEADPLIAPPRLTCLGPEGVKEGRLFRRRGRGGRVRAAGPGAWSIVAVVEKSAHAIEIEVLGTHDLRFWMA